MSRASGGWAFGPRGLHLVRTLFPACEQLRSCSVLMWPFFGMGVGRGV